MLILVSLLVARPALAGDLEALGRWMTGSFSSAAQAEADEDFFDIRLEMAPIWKERTDGLWLCVEQGGGMFAGSTVDDRCTSNLRGASYATSEAKVGPDRIEGWDRG